MTTERESLKPCPFCGSADLQFFHEIAIPAVQFVYCCGCEMSGPEATTLDGAIASWNRRAEPVGEPVAWRYRYVDDESHASEWIYTEVYGAVCTGRALTLNGFRFEGVALYAAPQEENDV